MVHMCLEREKINEQITILNYEENSKAFTGIEQQETYNLPRLQVLAASELSRLVHCFMTIKGNLSCNEAKNMSEDWRSCESFAKIFHLSPCLTS